MEVEVNGRSKKGIGALLIGMLAGIFGLLMFIAIIMFILFLLASPVLVIFLLFMR